MRYDKPMTRKTFCLCQWKCSVMPKQIVVLDKMSPLKKKKKLKRNDIIIFTKQEKFSIFFFLSSVLTMPKSFVCVGSCNNPDWVEYTFPDNSDGDRIALVVGNGGRTKAHPNSRRR